MNWARNLLFFAVVAGGLATLAFQLLPPRRPDRLHEYQAGAYQSADLRASVERVDAAFARDWQSNAIRPAPQAPVLTVARRLALGLMGTIPSLEEIRQLEALPKEQQLPWFLDRILGDSRFHDYFAERLARAYVGTEEGPPIFYRRRRFVTWLADQVAANRPYDQIVRELIASEGLWTSQPATNFVSVTSQPEMKNEPDPVRLAGRITRAFLGLRLDCAQCHNHPFSHWKQKEFHALSAFFGQTHTSFRGIVDGEGEYEAEDRYTKVKSVVAPSVPFASELLPEEGTRRERLAAWVTHPNNPYFARATVNRVWAILCGRPLSEPVDDLEAQEEPNRVLQVLADDFASHGFDLHRLIRVIAQTRAFQTDSAADAEITEAMERKWAVFPLTRLRPEQVAGSVIQAASVKTIDAGTHIVIRLIRQAQRAEFVRRYGDTGEDEFDGRGGTIPQALLRMNGELVRDRISLSPVNASALIAGIAPDDPAAIEVAYLAVLTRRPTAAERAYFIQALSEPGLNRGQKLEDLYWALINSTEFSWNH